MRADYRTVEGYTSYLEQPVIIPQQNENGLFTLIGFHDWEDVNDGKMTAAVTNLEEFKFRNESVGFRKD